jgi:hypothetical protein
MNKQRAAQPQPLGCACAAFSDAQTKAFIQLHDGRFYLGNREASSTNTTAEIGRWSSTLYGPEIRCCPFCGSKLKR